MKIGRCPEKYQRLNKLIQTSRKTEKTKNSQSFRVTNPNPTIKTTQKLTFKEPQEMLHEKLKIEYLDKIQWIIEALLVVGMSQTCENFCFANVMKHCPKDISRTMMNKVLHKHLYNRTIHPLFLIIIGNF